MILNSQDSSLLLMLLLLMSRKDLSLASFMNMLTLERGTPSMPLANLSGSKPQVDEVVGDKQCNESLESYALPLSIDSGLTYLHSIHPPTSIDIDSYPHVVFTSPHRWDPTVLEHDIILELLEDTDTSSDDSLLDDPFFGEFVEMNEQVVMALDCFLDIAPHTFGHHNFLRHENKQTPSGISWKALRPILATSSRLQRMCIQHACGMGAWGGDI